MGCSSSTPTKPATIANEAEFAGRSVARKASSVNRRGNQRKKSMKMKSVKDQATLAGESYHLMEACFQQLPGVINVKPGHCAFKGINIEAVQISFDSNKISYETLLKAYFQIHDPTTPSKETSAIQSIVFTHNMEQA